MKKKYISVMMLAAENSIYRALGLILVMGSLELLIFYYFLSSLLKRGNMPGLEELISRSGMSWIGLAAFVILCLFLLLPECEYGGSRVGYTIGRLAVSERCVYYLWTAYHVMVLILFWLAQLLIALIACRMYLEKAAPSVVSGQTVLLAFYRQGFLHNLMPLEEWSRYMRNILILVSLGFGISDFSRRQRQSEKSGLILVPLMCVLLGFRQGIGDWGLDIMVSLLNCILIGVMVRRLWGDET